MSLRHERVVESLRAGDFVRYSESGNSMLPVIRHRQEVLLAPANPSMLEVGQIVLAKVRGRFFLHRVNALDGNRVQIANNRGHVNGWTTRDRVFGIVVEIGGKPIRTETRNIRR